MRLSELVTAASRPMYWDVEQDIKDKGWKPYKKGQAFWDKNRSVGETVICLTKRVGGVALELVLSDTLYAISLSVGPSFGARLPIDLPDEQKKLTHQRLDISKGGKLSVLDAAAREVAKHIKALSKPKPKASEWQKYLSYKGKDGKEALEAWRKDASEVIVSELKSSKQYGANLWQQADSTHSLILNILNNYRIDCGLTRKTVNQEVVKILRRLVREKKVEELKPRDTGEKHTLWLWIEDD